MEEQGLNNIKNIIFDLGVVLLDIDFDKARYEFRKLGLVDFDSLYSKAYARQFFYNFETGNIDEKAFIHEIKKNIKKSVDDEKIINAWNAIIVGFPKEKVQFIQKISTAYKIFMLSNTNSLHAKKYENNFLDQSGISIHTVFTKIYYSHDIGIRKPDIMAYKIILEENNLKPEETLFIDDLEQNLLPAQELSMKTFHFEKETDLFSIFHL